MSTILLSGEQKNILIRLSQNAPEVIIHRARLILAYAEGKPTIQAAGEAGISRGRARYWKRQFISRGMGIFEMEPTPPKSENLTTEAADTADLTQEMKAPNTKLMMGGSEKKREVPYPKVKELIGMLPDDTLAAAGRKVWTFHFALMLRNEAGTLRGQDIEALHDMRVATRRMRTAFDVFGQAFDPKIMRHYLKGLRSAGRALGEVRDMDVLLQYALTYQKKMGEDKQSGLEPLISAWKGSIHKKRAKMTRYLQSAGYKNFKYHFNLFLQPTEDEKTASENLFMNARLCDIVPVLVYERYAAVRAYESILPGATIKQLHALRIEYKKFRYVLEYFREILGEGAAQAISEIKQQQDHFGELHDMDVACHLVGDFLKRWEEQQYSKPITERESPEAIVTYLAYLYSKRYLLVSMVPELWAKFNRPEFRQNIAQAISVL
jgi:CHAD domain-containing protein